MTAYPIPAEALDDRLGIVGTSGAGKTYTAMGAVERLLGSGARCIIVDPLDVWWGLRLTADGERASKFKLPILGGSHGDLPLTENSGALIGETVSGMAESCIISLGGFSSGAAERRFLLAFLTALYRRSSGALFHLVLDEADLWAPQQVFDKEGGTMQLKGVVENIVRRGRVKGFVPWLITQRPAVIDKSIMSMMVGLIAMKAMSPQDREAILAWLKGQMTPEQRAELDTAMPQLNIGEGIVWLPGHGVLQRAQFPAKATFDSSRAPKRGEVAPDRELKPLDLGALQARLSTVEAEVRANDPKALKAEVARLNAEIRQLSAKPAGTPVDPRAIAAAEEHGYACGKADGWEAGLVEGERRGSVAGQALALARARSALDGVKVDQHQPTAAPPRPAVPLKTAAKAPVLPKPASTAVAARSPQRLPEGDRAGLTGPQRHLMTALAWWTAMGHEAPTRTQIAAKAGWAPKGSTLRARLSELNAAGLVDYPQTGCVRLTPDGRATAPTPDLAETLHGSIVAILSGPQRALFDALEGAGGEVTRPDLAGLVGWEPGGSTLRARLSELHQLELVEYPARGSVKLQDWVLA